MTDSNLPPNWRVQATAATSILGFALLCIFMAHKGVMEAKACTDACYPSLSTRIEGVCHCATETGWERVPAEEENIDPAENTP